MASFSCMPSHILRWMKLRRRAEQEVSTLKERMQARERCFDEMQHTMFSQGSRSVETATPSPPNSVSPPVVECLVINFC